MFGDRRRRLRAGSQFVGPSGRRIELETRKALSCGCFDSSIVPERGADTLNSEPEKFKAKFDLFAGADEGTEERIRTDSI